MAHAASAIKRHRQSLQRRARNQARRSAARSAVRNAREIMVSGSGDAEAAVRTAASVLDRAARKGTLHPNNASRRKSRLMRQLNAAAASASGEGPARGTGRASRSRAKKS